MKMYSRSLLLLAAIALLCCVHAVDISHVPVTPRRTSFEQFVQNGVYKQGDHFEHVRPIIDHLDRNTDPAGVTLEDVYNSAFFSAIEEHSTVSGEMYNDIYESDAAVSDSVAPVNDNVNADGETSLVEVSAQAQVKRVRSYCEICILVMQMKQRGQPHLCAGLNALHYVTCIENLESLLRADKALVYWLKNGCMHMDSTGPEIVRPCPALPICSWVPNLFAQPPSIVRDGVESLCPKDPKFLPTIPNEYKTLLQPQTAAVPGPGGAGGGSGSS